MSIWDLESAVLPSPDGSIILEPLNSSGRIKGHKFGITAVQFYPFDSLAFTSSSYDHTLKLSSSETLQVSASFNLESVVYDHASSPIAQHLLVACATQHPNVRLVDLRSGSAAQALPGHHGAIMSVVWSPKDEYILASGGLDGTVRFWDVRRSAAQLGCLDMEDSIGIMGYDGLGQGARSRDRGRAHMGPVNGLAWTDDGKHLVSASHDEKIRVWNVIKGANTLANFGPLIRNRDLRRNVPCLVPAELTAHGSEALAIANEKEIMMFEMFEGKLMKRMRAPGVAYTGHSSTSATQKTKVLDLAWRTHTVELYSAHGDGSIRAWKPRTAEDVQADEEEREIERLVYEQKQKKRKVFEDMYSDLASKRFAIG